MTTNLKVEATAVPLRYAFCVDKKFSLEEFVTQTIPLTHPNSKHISAVYAKMLYQREYNYNNVGEFELLYIPAHSLDDDTKLANNNNLIYTWPDGIVFRGNDNPEIEKVHSLVSLPQLLDPQSSLIPQQSTAAFPYPAAIINVSKQHPWSQAKQSISWIKECIPQSIGTVKYLITRDCMQSQHGSWDVMFLPGGNRLASIISKKDIEKVTKEIF